MVLISMLTFRQIAIFETKNLNYISVIILGKISQTYDVNKFPFSLRVDVASDERHSAQFLQEAGKWRIEIWINMIMSVTQFPNKNCGVQ